MDTDKRPDTDVIADVAIPIERQADYARGWCEGVSAVLLEVMTGDFGGFLSAKRGGVDEEWIALGDIFDVVQRLQSHPRPPKAPKCVPVSVR